MRKIILMLLLLAAIGYVLTSRPSERLADGTLAKQELTFWGIYDLREIYQPAINAFESAHPNIRVVYKQFSDRQEYQQLLMTQLEKQKGPDIFFVDQDSQAVLQPYLVPTNAEDVKEFPPFVSQSLLRGDSLFALPLWVDSLVIYYNKRYFREGIKPLWHDFAKQTKAISIAGIAMGRLDNLRSGWDIIKALLLQKQVKLEGRPDNSLYDVLAFFIRFASPNDSYFNWNENLSKNYPDKEVDSFARGKVAAIAGYASLDQFFPVKLEQLSATGVRHIKVEDIGVSLFPQFDSNHPRYLSKYMAMGVSSSSLMPKTAWEFIRMLTNRENADYYAEASGRTAGRLLPLSDTASQIKRVQQLQLLNAEVYPISPEIQEQLRSVIERGLKNKNALKEVLNINFE